MLVTIDVIAIKGEEDRRK